MASFNAPVSTADIQTIFSSQNIRLDLQDKSFSNEEFWIRWYPDDIHLPIPIGKITKREKEIWSDIEVEFNNEINKDNGKDEADKERLKEELKVLIDVYLKNLKLEVVEIIKKNTILKSERLGNINKKISEASISFHNILFQIFENKDSINLKITAFRTNIAKFFNNLISEIPIYLDIQENRTVCEDKLAEIQNNFIKQSAEILKKIEVDIDSAKNDLGVLLKGEAELIIKVYQELIPKDIQEKTSSESTQKINDLTTELVVKAVQIAHPEDSNEERVEELLDFLESRPKDENTFYVDFINKLTSPDITKEDRNILLNLIEKKKSTLEKEIGIVRARQLAKEMLLSINGENWDFDTDLDIEDPLEILLEKGMQIKTLPEYINLYTIKESKYEGLLENPIQINREEVTILPSTANESNWFTDFDKALKIGMGIKITNGNKVEQVKEADWLIAVGFSNSEELYANLEETLKRRNANGELSIVPQDTPTNNTENSTTPYTNNEDDLVTYFEKTSTTVPTNIPYQSRFKGSLHHLDPKYSVEFSDAHILTNIFKFDENTFGEIMGSDLHEQKYATAMNLLLWDASLLEFKRIWTEELNNSLPDWNQFSNFFFNNVRARGNLPIIRVGKNPYGILPVVSLKNWNPIASIGENPGTLKCIRDFFYYLKPKILSGAQGKKPPSWTAGLNIKPPLKIPNLVDASEEEAYETFLDILRTTRLSRKLHVRLLDPDDIFNFNNSPGDLACELVKDSISDYLDALPGNIYKETAYLNYLSNSDYPLTHFKEEPWTENPPVLKRIIYYILEKSALSDNNIRKLAKILKNVHPTKLEFLLMEFFDLLTYRIDAWITGIAHERLINYLDFEHEDMKPSVGVYGWLEKPGKIIPSSNSVSEYIQAPSLDQAVTVALLRNTSLMSEVDDPSGQFRINLSSDQIRRGMWYFEGLRHNRTPEELLGYRIERYIHDNKDLMEEIEEKDIFLLRRIWPLTVQNLNENHVNDEVTYVETIVNGLHFLESDLTFDFEPRSNLKTVKEKTKATGITKADYERFDKIKPDLQKIKDEIRKYYDAAADIATSEVLFQYLRGNIDRTSAWLDFLDGNGFPPEPEVTKVQRTGDRQGTKVILLIDQPEQISTIFEDGYNIESSGNPRKITSPLIDHLCNKILGELSEEFITFNLIFGDVQKSLEIQFQHIDSDAIDLIVGGEIELELRLKYLIIHNWEEYPELGPYPEELTPQELFNMISIECLLDENLRKKVLLLKKIIHQNMRDNREISLEPNEELEILKEQDCQSMDLSKTIEILVKRSDKLYNQLCLLNNSLDDLYEYQPFALHIFSEKIRKLLELVSDVSPPDYSKWKELASELDDIIHLNSDKKISVLLDSIINPTREDPVPFYNLIDILVNAISDETSYNLLISNLISFLTEIITKLESLIEEVEDSSIETSNYSIAIEDLPLNLSSDNIFLTLLEVSQYGYSQALLPFPRDIKSLYHFNTILDDLLDKINLKLDNFLNFFELLTETSEDFELASTCSIFDSVESWLGLVQQKLSSISDWKNRMAYVKKTNIIPALISNLQDFTDGKKLPIFTPYVLNSTANDWSLNLTNFEGPFDLNGEKRPLSNLTSSKKDNLQSIPRQLSGSNPLNYYESVRKRVSNLLDLLGDNVEFKVYEEKYKRPLEVFETSENLDEIPQTKNTNYLYVSPFSNANLKCFSCLYVDDWMEFFPNLVETTGVAYRYDAPQTEAPNTILLAVPPTIDELTGWEPQKPDLLAQTILETLELMQIRMITSYDIINSTTLGKNFPALIFRESKVGAGKDYYNALFPQKPKLFLKGTSKAPFYNLPGNFILSQINATSFQDEEEI
ncbi:MAG: hypothetical protein ACTSR8_06525 [Promethearchaeota archaeon]